MPRLSNNQSHEMKQFQTLVARMRELEDAGGFMRVQGRFEQIGVTLVIPDPLTDMNANFTVLLDPTKSPLRVVFIGGAYQELMPRPYPITLKFIRHAIAEVEKQICWTKYYLEMGDQEIGDDEGEPEIYHEVNLGDTPGGFKIYE